MPRKKAIKSNALQAAERAALDEAGRRRLYRAHRRLGRAFSELTDTHILLRACSRSYVAFASMDTLHDMLIVWIDSGVAGDDVEIKRLVNSVLGNVLQDLKIDAAERASTHIPPQ